MTALFHGTEICEVSADGTASLPAFITEALGADAAADLLVSKHDDDSCLVGYARPHLGTLAERNEQRRLSAEARGEDAAAHYRRMRRTFGLVDRMPRETDTIRIPEAMRHLGRIGTLALFVGTGDRFEIWNPDLAMECDDASFRDLAAFRMQSHASKGVH